MSVRVLLLEDEAIVRHVAREWFDGSRGILMHTTDCPKKFQALATNSGEHYAALIADYRLPDGRTGCDVLQCLIDGGVHVPLIVWTAIPEEAMADKRCKSSRILDIVPKPNLAELEYRLRIALGSLEIERQNLVARTA